jgi:hypothetical protein
MGVACVERCPYDGLALPHSSGDPPGLTAETVIAKEPGRASAMLDSLEAVLSMDFCCLEVEFGASSDHLLREMYALQVGCV